MKTIINSVASIIAAISMICIIIFLGIAVYRFAFEEFSNNIFDMPVKGIVVSMFLFAVFGMLASVTED